MILAGSVEERAGGTTAHGGPLHVVVKPRGTYHESRFGPHSSVLLQVALPDEVVREAISAGCPLDRWSWSEAGNAAPGFVRLARLCLDGAGGDSVRDALHDVLGAVKAPSPQGPAPRWLRRARRHMREVECDGERPLSVATLARDAGVHRVHFSREFQRFYGTSPTEYRMRLRMGRVAERVGAGSEALSEIAHDAGFADQAHMTRSFHRDVGTTPLEYRRLVGEAQGN